MREDQTRLTSDERRPKRLFLSSCFVVIGTLIVLSGSAAFASVLHAALYPPQDGSVSPGISDSASATLVTDSAPSPADDPAPTAAAPKPAHAAVQDPPGTPHELIIPSLHIDSAIEKVGLNAKGNIGTPSSFSRTAWYDDSPKPGDPGLSIIDGHVDNGLGLAGVFVHLAEIKTGADIYVTDADGAKIHFIVIATSTVDYTSRLSEVTALQTGTRPELALITCEGDWVASNKTYDKRIVVLAELADGE